MGGADGKMDTTTLLVLGRVLERLVLVVAGIVLIVLGYYLYLNGVGGEAKIAIETTGQKYQLENAAPGIVFALLGAIVLGRSILSPLKIEETTAAEAANAEKPTRASSSKPVAEQTAHRNTKSIHYSDTATVASGLQLQGEDIPDLYRAVRTVVSDEAIDSKVRNALGDAYRRIYERNKLGPDGTARLQELSEMTSELLTADQSNELKILRQRIPLEFSPERFR